MQVGGKCVSHSLKETEEVQSLELEEEERKEGEEGGRKGEEEGGGTLMDNKEINPYLDVGEARRWEGLLQGHM